GGAFGGSFGAGFDGEGGGSLFEDGSVRKPSGTFAEVDGRLSGTSWRAVEVFGFGAGGLAFAGAGVGAAGASTTVLAGVSPGGSSGRDAAAGAVGTIGWTVLIGADSPGRSTWTAVATETVKRIAAAAIASRRVERFAGAGASRTGLRRVIFMMRLVRQDTAAGGTG